MRVTEVTEDIYRLSANVSADLLFEGIWPLPHGLSMNSFLIKAEQCALIDGVCGWDGVPETLLAQLEEMQIDPREIRYVVLNHLEPDHTGWLTAFRKIAPHFVPVATSKGLELLKALFEFSGEGLAVKSGDTLPLGRGRELVFEEIPNVHWPETMATFERFSGTLFPCDAFSSFGAVAEASFDDQLSETELSLFETEALRYFANILATFSTSVERAIRKLKPLQPRIIAPAHGIVWRKDPGRIMSLYEKLVQYSRGFAEPEIAVIWGSMYGNTEQALKHLLDGIRSEQVPVHVHQVPQTHISHILASALRSAAVVVGAPTYEYKLFPPMAEVIDELGRKKVQNRKSFYFGSFGWSGGAEKELAEIVERWKMNWTFIEPVLFQGKPRAEELGSVYQKGRELAALVKESSRNGRAAHVA